MKLGFIGLGRIGGGMVRRLVAAGHEVVVHDVSAERVTKMVALGATSADSFASLVGVLPKEKTIVWIMVPQAAVEEVLDELTPLLSAGSIVIDGGNSNFNISKARGEALAKNGIHFLDVGTSGGLGGAEAGYSMMAGGDKGAFDEVKPILDALGIEGGTGHFGSHGAGHFVKMVHNAIEYGIMQSIGEGFDLMKNGPYKDIDLARVSSVWNHGSIVRSFLMELVEKALGEDKNLDAVSGVIGDSGEGRWSVETALAHSVPFTANTYAVFYRYITRENPGFGAKVVAALRTQFGGHTNKERA